MASEAQQEQKITTPQSADAEVSETEAVEELNTGLDKADKDAAITSATTPLPELDPLDVVVDRSGSIIPREEARANLAARRP